MKNKYFFFGFGQVAKYFLKYLIKKKKNLNLIRHQPYQQKKKFSAEKNIFLIN